MQGFFYQKKLTGGAGGGGMNRIKWYFTGSKMHIAYI